MQVIAVAGALGLVPADQPRYKIKPARISIRHFKRQFNLADYVQVKNASFDNGQLKIELVREIPETMKPRKVAINGGHVHQLEGKAA
jgi:HSP20 family molecular chaperone IbpA